MNKENFANLFTTSLGRYNFKHYGSKLFYLDLSDAIIILKHLIWNGGGEVYLELIIKKCHHEINKITKKIIQDKMLIDTYSSNKLLYRTVGGYNWDFFQIEEINFDDVIDAFYNESIKPFEISYINGIQKFNELYSKIFYGQQIDLYKDSASKIEHMELASFRDHNWLLSDSYRLDYEYKVDSRFINSNTVRYIMENIITKVPSNLKGKEKVKWYNRRCKEIFISKKMRRDFGWGIVFPFIDGKPLKLLKIDINKENGKSVEVYINEETNEIYHCVRISSHSNEITTYELWKVK